VDSLAELNARVAAAEVPLLVPVPDEPFETGLLLTPRVDRYSQVTVRMNRYSVPVRLIGRQVRVVLRSSELVIYDGRHEAARHERAAGRGVHRRARGAVVGGPPRGRGARRDPRPGRGPAAAPAHGRR
jgi:hypothetical protein